MLRSDVAAVMKACSKQLKEKSVKTKARELPKRSGFPELHHFIPLSKG